MLPSKIFFRNRALKPFQQIILFSVEKRKRPTIGSRRKEKDSSLQVTPAPPAPSSSNSIQEAWVEVKDPQSGQIYYWNKLTNETTHLGAPRPTTPSAQTVDNSAYQQPSLMRTVAEGFSFGIGSSIARSVVGSFFGSDDSSGSIGGGSSSDDNDDSYDV
jgi:hypothetical protein